MMRLAKSLAAWMITTSSFSINNTKLQIHRMIKCVFMRVDRL